MVWVYAMKNILYTLLLSIIFLAPQGELLADSDNQHNKIKPEKYKKVKHKHDKFWRVPFATKADLELINQDILVINASLDALELQVGVSPEELAAALAPLQDDIDALKLQVNVSPEELAAALAPLQADIDANSTNVTLALDDITKIRTEDIAGIQEAITSINKRIDALDPTDPPKQDLVFSGFFIEGFLPSFRTVADWDQFKRNATGDFSTITIRNVLGGGSGSASVVCPLPANAALIANALNTYVPTVGRGAGEVISVTCIDPAFGEVNWNIGSCNGEVELNASLNTKTVCSAINGAVVRPLINNPSWGGIGAEFGGGGTTSQTLEVILTR